MSLLRVIPWLVIFCGLVVFVCGCLKLPRRKVPNVDNSSVAGSNTALRTQRININIASAKELEELPGIGPVLAQRIIAHREQYGPFHRVEHLMMVHGFSDHKFRALREQVTVE